MELMELVGGVMCIELYPIMYSDLYYLHSGDDEKIKNMYTHKESMINIPLPSHTHLVHGELIDLIENVRILAAGRRARL